MVRINHLSLAVEDLDGVKNFFEKVLGFNVRGEPKRAGYRVTDGAISVAIDPCRAGESPRIGHFGVEVEDVDKFVAEIRRHGCEVFISPAGNQHFRFPGGAWIDVEIVPVGAKPVR